MKNRIFGLLLVVTSVVPAFAGAISEAIEKGGFIGKIEYTMEYELPEAYESQRAMLPTEMTTYIGGDFTRVEQNTGLGEQITINDLKTGGSVVLMNMMGQKIALSTEGASKDFTPEIEETGDTKEIAGYTCKKVIYTIPDDKVEPVSFEIYYTDAISESANTQFPGLKGFPLEYVMETQGMVITYVAKSVTEEKVAKSLSKVPEGYEKMTYEDFVKMMGG